MNLGGRPREYGRTRGVHPDPCPYCPHESELHRVCNDCDNPTHAVCTGLARSPKHPTSYVPCHCTWIPGQPKEVTVTEESAIEISVQDLTREEAAKILATFSQFIAFADSPETIEEVGEASE